MVMLIGSNPKLSCCQKDRLIDVIKTGTLQDLLSLFDELQYISLDEEQMTWEDQRKELVNEKLIPCILRRHPTPSSPYSSHHNYKEEQWRAVSDRVFAARGVDSSKFTHERNKYFVSNFGRLVFFNDVNCDNPIPILSTATPNIDDSYIRSAFYNTKPPPGENNGGLDENQDEEEGVSGCGVSSGSGSGGGGGTEDSYIKKITCIPRSYVVFFTFYKYDEFDFKTMIIDHINEDRSDNHMINLWPLSMTVNKRVRAKKNRSNTSTANGITELKGKLMDDGSYIERFQINKPTSVGGEATFDSNDGDGGEEGGGDGDGDWNGEVEEETSNSLIFTGTNGLAGAIRLRASLEARAGWFSECCVNHILFMFFKRKDLLQLHVSFFDKTFVDGRDEDDNDSNGEDTLTNSNGSGVASGVRALLDLRSATRHQTTATNSTATTTTSSAIDNYMTPSRNTDTQRSAPISSLPRSGFATIKVDGRIIIADDSQPTQQSGFLPQSEPRRLVPAPRRSPRLLVQNPSSAEFINIPQPLRVEFNRDIDGDDDDDGEEMEEWQQQDPEWQLTLADLLVLDSEAYEIERGDNNSSWQSDPRYSLYHSIYHELQNVGIHNAGSYNGYLLKNNLACMADSFAIQPITYEQNTLNEFVRKITGTADGCRYTIQKYTAQLRDASSDVDVTVAISMAGQLISFLYNVTVVYWRSDHQINITQVKQHHRWDAPRGGGKIIHIFHDSGYTFFPLRVLSSDSRSNLLYKYTADSARNKFSTDDNASTVSYHSQFFEGIDNYDKDQILAQINDLNLNDYNQDDNNETIPDECDVVTATLSPISDPIKFFTYDNDGALMKHTVVSRVPIEQRESNCKPGKLQREMMLIRCNSYSYFSFIIPCIIHTILLTFNR